MIKRLSNPAYWYDGFWGIHKIIEYGKTHGPWWIRVISWINYELFGMALFLFDSEIQYKLICWEGKGE